MIRKLIKSEDDYNLALTRIEQLMDSKPGSPEFDELELLSTLVEIYEDEHFPIDMPDPVSAIKFRMEQLELNQQGLVPFIGSRSKVSEVLNRKRSLTLAMMRSLHKGLGIPSDVLLQEPEASFPISIPHLEWTKFPVVEMAGKGWIAKDQDIKGREEELIRGLIEQAGGLQAASACLFRKGQSTRENSKNDPYAIKAWCLKVMAVANANPLKSGFKKGIVNAVFLKDIVKFSYLENGPTIAKEYIEKHGIHFVVLPHLRQTYLDGAAFMLPSGNPVIGLTLRYDRLDNFWFCLLHELAHVSKHLTAGKGDIIIDDLDLRRLQSTPEDQREVEADRVAQEALIPNKGWRAIDLYGKIQPRRIRLLADKLKIHPAIIAGRIRYEKNNYRILSSLIGNREVRKQFPDMQFGN
jgi:HTH-type transcriptional regulator/antitoxin HigA